jgi:transposase
MTARVWARRNTRPRTPKQCEYGYVYVFGAVHPRTGESMGLLLPYCNTGMMNLVLEHLGRGVPAGRRIALVVDNAGWHYSNGLEIPANISLIFLPPYSPELNPIEGVWEFVKGHYLCNRIYENYDALLDAGADALKRLNESRIKSICWEDWMDCTN